jgi:hypothetical protein
MRRTGRVVAGRVEGGIGRKGGYRKAEEQRGGR